MYIIDTNKDSNLIIELTQNDNNTGNIEFQILKDGKPLNITSKKVKLALVKNTTNKGDIITNVNITNPTSGIVSVPITTLITGKKGLFVCGLAVYSGGYLENTGNFRLNVKRDIFEDTAESIISGSAYSELMNILKTAKDTIGNIDKTLQSKLTKFEEDKNNFIKKAEQEKKDTLNKITTDTKKEIDNFILETRTTITEINTSGKKAIKNFSEESEKALNKVNIEIKASVTSFERQKAESIEDFKTRTKEQLEAQKEENKNILNSTKEQLNNLVSESQKDLSKIKQTKEEIEGLKTNVDETVAEYEQKINNSIDNFNSTKVETLKNFKSEKDKVITEFKAEGKTEADNRKKEWDSLKKIAIEENNAVELQSQINTLDKALKSNQSLGYRGENITCNDTLSGRTENLQILGDTKYKREDNSLTDVWEEGVSLESTGEKEKNLIKIKSCGKNLIEQSNKEGVMNGVNWCFKDGFLILNGTASEYGDVYYMDYDIKINTTNYKYLFICAVSGEKYVTAIKTIDYNGVVSYPTFENGTHKINTQEIKYIENIRIYIRKGAKFNNVKIKLSLQEDESCEPYTGDTKQIQLPNPLRKVGDVADRIYEKDGKVWLEENIGEVVLNGSENWKTQKLAFEDLNGYYTSVTELKLKEIKKELKSDKLEFCEQVGVNSEGFPFKIGLNLSLTNLLIDLPKEINIKKWLSENPTTVLYQLKTPIVTELNIKNIDLDTFSPITHITSDNNIQPTLDFKVPSNLASIVQANSRAINEIYDLIDTLITPQLIQNRLDIDINKFKK